jgi:hypothetical protein
MPSSSLLNVIDMNALIAFVQRNWPAVTAAAVVLATLILLKRRKKPYKPVAIACYPHDDELPPPRARPFYMLKEDVQDITFSKRGVASKEFCPAKTVFGVLRCVDFMKRTRCFMLPRRVVRGVVVL